MWRVALTRYGLAAPTKTLQSFDVELNVPYRILTPALDGTGKHERERGRFIQHKLSIHE